MSKKRRTANQSLQRVPVVSSKSSDALVDVIIPVHRRIDLLAKCIEALPAAMGDVPFRLIVFDNGTPVEERKDYYQSLRMSDTIEHLRLMENSTNLGFPIACNKAAQVGSAPLLFFLNSDVVLDPGSVKLLVNAMDDATIGVVGMKLVFPANALDLNPNIRPANKLQHIGLMTNIRGQVVHAYMAWDENHPKVMSVREVLGVTGAALMTRRVLWNQIGGFLKDYGMGTYEDIDYCMRCRELNHNVIVVPQARGVHYTGATAEKYHMPYPLQMNQMIFMQRWAGKLPWTEYLTS